MVARIGLTSRMIKAPHYNEWRDALATDWARAMPMLLPEGQWIALPNVGSNIVKFVEEWGLTGFVLTGGDDIGITPERDATEKALLYHAIDRELPVLGVCRGMQILQHNFDGALTTCDPQIHVNAVTWSHLVAYGNVWVRARP